MLIAAFPCRYLPAKGTAFFKGDIKLCLFCETIKQQWCMKRNHIRLKNKIAEGKMMHYFNNPLHFYSSFHHKDQRSTSTNNKCRDHAPSCLNKSSQEDNSHIYTHSATSSVIK